MRPCSPAPRELATSLEIPGTQRQGVSQHQAQKISRIPHLPQDVKATSEAQSPRLRLHESPSEPKAAQAPPTPPAERGN